MRPLRARKKRRVPESELTEEERRDMRALFEVEKKLTATAKGDPSLQKLLEKTKLRVGEDISPRSLKVKKEEWIEYIKKILAKSYDEGKIRTAEQKERLQRYATTLLELFFGNINAYLELEKLANELNKRELLVKRLREIELQPDDKRKKEFEKFAKEVSEEQLRLLPKYLVEKITLARRGDTPEITSTLVDEIQMERLVELTQHIGIKMEAISDSFSSYKETIEIETETLTGEKGTRKLNELEDVTNQLFMYNKQFAKFRKGKKYLSQMALTREYNAFIEGKFRKVFTNLIDQAPEEFGNDEDTKKELKLVLEALIKILKNRFSLWKITTVISIGFFITGFLVATQIKKYTLGVGKEIGLLKLPDPTYTVVGSMILIAAIVIAYGAMQLYGIEKEDRVPKGKLY